MLAHGWPFQKAMCYQGFVIFPCLKVALGNGRGTTEKQALTIPFMKQDERAIKRLAGISFLQDTPKQGLNSSLTAEKLHCGWLVCDLMCDVKMFLK